MSHTMRSQYSEALVRHPQRLAALARLAVSGQAVLVTTALLLPGLSEYTLVSDNISELALGRFGFVQTLAFLIAGLGTLGLAYAIRSLTSGAPMSLVGSLLVGLYGVGAILAAVFPTDRIDDAGDVWAQSPTGTVHAIVTLVRSISIILGMFALVRAFRREALWRPTLPWSVIFPAAALSLFVVQSEGPWVGLMQRLLAVVIAAWLVLVARRVRSIAASAS